MEKKEKKDGLTQFADNLIEFAKGIPKLFEVLGIGLVRLWPQLKFKSPYFWISAFNVSVLCIVMAYRPPKFIFNYMERHSWPQFILRFYALPQFAGSRLRTLLFMIVIIVPFIVGLVQHRRKMKLQKGLDDLRLGHDNNRPKILKMVSEEDQKTRLRILSSGVGYEKFLNRKGDLEAGFGQLVDSIYPEEENPQIINITLSKIPLPRMVFFDDHLKELNKEGDFLVGQSRQGFIVQNIAELPHLLIAGTTGSGKSVFFKQALLSLMEITPNSRFYLLDFKRGVEFGAFSKIPSVRVIKEKESALKILKEIEAEMKSRFDYLEQNKINKIDPDIQQMPRIFVAIDEASELLAVPNRFDPDKEKVAEARMLVNNIAKLGRAAAIHLLIATQKVSKTIIDTALQENIGGRMAFRMATLANSAQVLGTKDARDIPEIPGRGKWQFGTKSFDVQVPYIDEKEIDKKIKVLADARTKGNGGTQTDKPNQQNASDDSNQKQKAHKNGWRPKQGQ